MSEEKKKYGAWKKETSKGEVINFSIEGKRYSMWVNTYKSGFSSIHTCNGSDITIKTNLIKNIEIK